jgi:UDPglucose 6-dehydrogenase
MKISFINAVANVCEANHADIEEVVEGMGSDQRIGKRFLKPGIGYGGSCFPKDLSAFRQTARDSGYEFPLLDEVMHINQSQRCAFVRKVRKALWTLKGKRLAVLGLAFKGGTDDVRESPAIAVIHELLQHGAEIIAYDPAAKARAQAEFNECQRISFASSAYDAARDADALLVLTDWEEFAALDLDRLRAQLHHPIIIDGRNLYSPKQMLEAGISYYSIGRPEVASKGLPVMPRSDAAEAA